MSLTYLFSKKEPSKRLERWKERLQLYVFTTRYKAGKENIVADALSRYNEDCETPKLDQSESEEEEFNDLIIAGIEQETLNATESPHELDEYEVYRHEQDQDPDIMWIKNMILENGNEKPKIRTFENRDQRILYRDYNSLRVICGMLYKTAEDRNGKELILFTLPKTSINKILDQIHNSIYGGHLGKRKTTKKMLDRFYCPFLRDHIKHYIQECDRCQKIKTTSKKTENRQK